MAKQLVSRKMEIGRKFVPLPLFAGSGPEVQGAAPMSALWHPVFESVLQALPAGPERFWGIPFDLAKSSADRRWLWLGPSAEVHHVQVGVRAPFIVFAHFCMPSPASADSRGQPLGAVMDVGQRLADFVLVYEDGTEHRQAIRRRFEINDVLITWGQLAALARPHRADRPRDWRGPHAEGEWGWAQTGVQQQDYFGVSDIEPPRQRDLGNYWIYAMANPKVRVPIDALRLEWAGASSLAVAGVTAFHGKQHPLRYGPLRSLLISSGRPLPSVDIDLGVVARRYRPVGADRSHWTQDPAQGLGSRPVESSGSEVIDLVGSDAATIAIGASDLEMGEIASAGEIDLPSSDIRVQVLPPPSIWVDVTVLDKATGRPTPSRVHFSAQDGRYFPPFGHRREINDSWFQDNGADLRLGEMSYAYVDGKFRIQLPIGDAYVEIAKGFEHQPLRARIQIQPTTDRLSFELSRMLDWRRDGWVSADTHVHFLPPQTARLEAQAEGVNLVNLLATQWGDLYTNVDDFRDLQTNSTDDTIVRLGSENRHHFLGHLGLLGTRDLVTPLSTGGPDESYFGDPTSVSLAEWADACHSKGGLAIAAHFPQPQCEVAADIVLGKIDAVEIRDFWSSADTYATREWYRFLNCGFRVPVVGGTDKMSAGMPVGGVRTYASIGDSAFDFNTWASAVRKGRTFTSSGPLIELRVDGHEVGDCIPVPKGGLSVTLEARAVSYQSLRSLEVVHNGRVVAVETSAERLTELSLVTELRVSGPGWIAARCTSDAVAWHAWPVRLAAHTSPVYLGEIKRELYDDSVALDALLELGIGWAKTIAIRGDRSSNARLQSTFEQAKAELRPRRRYAR